MYICSALYFNCCEEISRIVCVVSNSWTVRAMVLELKMLEEGVTSRIGRPRLKAILAGVKLAPEKLWCTARP